MNTTTPLEIKVVFDASSHSRRGGTAQRARARSRHEGSYAWTVVAVLNLLVALAMYYGIWWRVDPEIYLILMMKTPVEMDLDMAAGIFVPSSRPSRTAPVPRAVPQEAAMSQYEARTAQWLI